MTHTSHTSIDFATVVYAIRFPVVTTAAKYWQSLGNKDSGFEDNVDEANGDHIICVGEEAGSRDENDEDVLQSNGGSF